MPKLFTDRGEKRAFNHFLLQMNRYLYFFIIFKQSPDNNNAIKNNSLNQKSTVGNPKLNHAVYNVPSGHSLGVKQPAGDLAAVGR